jgi:hypothetical protein
MIDENGYISCTLCNIKYEFFDYRFGCYLHQGDLLKPDRNLILNSFINNDNLQAKMGGYWLKSLLGNLIEMDRGSSGSAIVSDSGSCIIF